MKSKYWGLLILAVVAIVAILYPIVRPPQQQEVVISGYLGGEKKGLISNPKFQEILKDKYNLTMNYKVLGSLDMIREDLTKQDFVFPSSQLALELFNQEGKKATEDEIIFNTPIVIYSRKKVVDALLAVKVVSQNDGIYSIDMVKLANLMKEEKTWPDIGFNDLNSKILVATTNPNESNSGNMFLGLLANALNNNQMLDEASLTKISPILQKIYQSLGYMQTSSSDMFNQFMKMGYGAYPLVAGYESQLLEFSKQHPDVYKQVKDDICILYPNPTVWSSHVYIALNDEAKVAIEALTLPEVQELAWKDHGFRTIVSGTADTKEFPVPGLAKDLTQIMPMPRIELMQKLMDIVK